MRTLTEIQIEFDLMLARLLLFAHEQGIKTKITCLFRTKEEQAKMVASGKSRTMESRHLQGLAADLAIIDMGRAVWDAAAYKPLGDFWTQIGGVWGGSWKEFPDAVHFEHKGV